MGVAMTLQRQMRTHPCGGSINAPRTRRATRSRLLPRRARCALGQQVPEHHAAHTDRMFRRPNDNARWYVTERAGRLVSFPNNSTATNPDVKAALDLRQNVYTGFDCSLSGIALPPDFATGKHAFVCSGRPDVHPAGSAVPDPARRCRDVRSGPDDRRPRRVHSGQPAPVRARRSIAVRAVPAVEDGRRSDPHATDRTNARASDRRRDGRDLDHADDRLSSLTVTHGRCRFRA